MLLGGCDSGQSESESGSDPVPEKQSMSIDAIFESLQPERYGISVPPGLPTTHLNNWGAENLDKLLNEDVDETALRAKLSPLLTEEQIDRVLRREFVIRDSVHLRDMVWARQLMGALQVADESDLAQITRLFYFVNTLIRLNAKTETALPLSPFDTALYGRGTAADRVWVFSCLARQLGLPVLVVEAEGVSNSGLAGVLIDEEIYLFDFELGLPVPSASSPANEALPSVPASLREVLANDSGLRAFDVVDGEPYPVTSASLKQSRLLLAGDSSVWARRVEAVQYAMSGNSVPTVYEPLVAHGAFEEDGGIMEIVSEAVEGLIAADSVAVWSYPETQRNAAEMMSPEQKELLRLMHEPMTAPRPYRQTNSENGPVIVFGAGRQLQLKARLKQILGQPQEAIAMYLKTQASRRSAPKADPRQIILPELEQQLADSLPKDVLQLHTQAGLDAMYWQATCQLQLGKLSAAATDFSRWLISVGSRNRVGQAALLTAVSFARQGQFLSASGFLNRVPKDDVQYRTSRILLARWKAIEAAGE